jgi:RNA polymerase sigma factor (sigma-70 family)
MRNLSKEEILEAIKREDRRVLIFLYSRYYPSVSYFIKKHSGTEMDAQDIFQDALVVIFLKVKESIPELKSTFTAYLRSIVSYLWIKELRRRQISKRNIQFPDMEDLIEDSIVDEYILMEKRKLVLENFYKLGEDCQKLLTLFINETPVFRITKIMGFSSDQYCRNRKTSCKEKLVRKIWNSPRYNELKNESYQQGSKVPRW